MVSDSVPVNHSHQTGAAISHHRLYCMAACHTNQEVVGGELY